MRICITGSSGYLGSLVLEKLEEHPQIKSIVGIDINHPRKTYKKLEFHKKDITENGLWEVMEGCDVLLHLAFIVEPILDYGLIYEINLHGSTNVFLSAIKGGINKIIYTSSVAAYGIMPDKPEVISPSTPMVKDTRSYYGHTKYLVEKVCDRIEELHPQVSITRLRPSVVAGARCPNFFNEFMLFPFLMDVPHGAAIPLVHEDDLAEAVLLSIFSEATGPFLVSYPESLPMKELAKILKKPCPTLPPFLTFLIGKILWRLRLSKFSMDWFYLFYENRFRRFDISRTRELLGWEPRKTAKETAEELVRTASFPWTDFFKPREFRIGGSKYR